MTSERKFFKGFRRPPATTAPAQGSAPDPASARPPGLHDHVLALLDRLRLLADRQPATLDAVAAAALYLLLALSPDDYQPAPTKSLPALLMLAVSCVALAVRRRRPLHTLAVTSVIAMIAVACGSGLETFVAPVVFAVYTVAVSTDRRTAWACAVPVALVLATVAVVFSPEQSDPSDPLGRFGWIGMAAGVGDAVRSHRAYISAIKERAERAERTREEEARRRVAEERLHIARELHDVVAHHIAVINLQAGVAEHLLSTRPATATEALAEVRRASRTALEELGGLLGVLRSQDEGRPPTEPSPGIAQLSQLIDTYRSAGLKVHWTPGCDMPPLPASTDLVAYRLIQEALTNAHRHGTGTAEVTVTQTRTALTLNIANPVPRRPALPEQGGTGLGLIGMRERAHAVGGILRTGPDDDQRFHVRATLPLTGGQDS
ncbi:sensor histidine kinase [Streptomyces sp. NPDC060205]|uniref:sensor histidine kinase n=1 Tax=Streptomyces sp. NPDC060205 TaxID=3347072 RepID=UPI00364EA91C